MRKSVEQKPTLESRRNFLKGFAVGGVAAASALAAGRASASVGDDLQPEVSREKHGYRKTKHIEDYYARADF